MNESMITVEVPLRTVVNGIGYCNIFSPQTSANPAGWLILRQYTRRGKWYPSVSFPLSSTYSALLWYVRAKSAIAQRIAGHDGVRLVFSDGSDVATFVKYAAKSGKIRKALVE
jgi:hypothetical protein